MKPVHLLLTLLLPASCFAQINFIKINGYKVEYEASGSGRHTIFLEAGGSAGLSDWDPIYKSLAKESRVIRYSRKRSRDTLFYR